MLKIFFNAEDVARIRVLPEPDPIWELVLSMIRLRGRYLDPALSAWRTAALAELRRPHPDRELSRDLAFLFALLPTKGYFPDFLTPSDAVGASLDDGLAAIRRTPAEYLRRDLDTLAASAGSLPPAVSALAGGDPAAMTALTDTMRAYFDVALAPAWARVTSAFGAERMRLSRAVLDGGITGLLGALNPLMRWHDGVLHVTYPVDQELRPEGRGLVLVPAYFCWRHPVTLRDPGRAPVLVYPVARPHGWTSPEGTEQDPRAPLAALLGGNRAAALAAVAGGCSTSELARRVGISLASASQHASVLRNAGLISSHRQRHTMIHTLTPLGLAILHGG